MASKSLGTLTLDLIAKIGGYTQGLSEAERQTARQTKQMAKHVKEMDKIFSEVGKGLAVGATTAFALATAALYKVGKESIQAQKEQGQLAAVLKSTGSAAGFSQNQLNDMAGALENVSTVSAGEINQAQTTLLAFTGIVGGQFSQALQSAIDMSARTGISVVSAAETIGRALDKPSQGMSALSKQGFRFSEEQVKLAKNLEKAGRTAEAQDMVLRELTSSYGGAALAAREVFGGSLDGLKNRLNSLMTGDDGSLDGATKSINELTASLGSPETKQAFAEVIGLIVDMTTAIANMSVEFGLGLRHSDGFFDALWKYGLTNPFKSTSDHISEISDQLDQLAKNGKIKGVLAPAIGTDDFWEKQKRSLEQQLSYYKAVDGRQKNLLNPPSSKVPTSTGNASAGSGVMPVVKDYDAAEKAAKKHKDEIDRLVKALKEQVATLGMSSAEVEKWKFVQAGADKPTLKVVDGLIEQKQAFDRATAATQLNNEAMLRNSAIFEEMEMLRKQNARVVASMGMGSVAREQMEAEFAIEQEYHNKRIALVNELNTLRANQATNGLKIDEVAFAARQKDLEDQLEQTRQTEAERVRIAQEGAQLKIEAERNWILGVQEAINNYADSSKNMYSQMQQATSQLFDGLTDSATKWVMGMDASFDDVLKSFAQMIIKMQIQAATVGAMGAMFGGTSFGALFGFSDGGYTGAGGKHEPKGVVHGGEYVINKESTQRLGLPFLNSLNGYADGGFVGNAPSGVGGGSPVNINTTVNVAQTTTSTTSTESQNSLFRQLGNMVDQAVQSRLAREVLQGGVIWKIRNGMA
jgi:lambda family phage tail tape measure protein